MFGFNRPLISFVPLETWFVCIVWKLGKKMNSLPAWWNYFWPPIFSQTKFFFTWPNMRLMNYAKFALFSVSIPKSCTKVSFWDALASWPNNCIILQANSSSHFSFFYLCPVFLSPQNEFVSYLKKWELQKKVRAPYFNDFNCFGKYKMF